MFKYETSKLRLNSQGNCGADRVCWFKYKNVIEQSVMGSNYASVERLSPSRQWLPTGETIVVRRAMSESKGFRTRDEVPREKSSLWATLMGPQSLMHAACVLGIIFQQKRNKIPWHFVWSRSCIRINKLDLRCNFLGNLTVIFSNLTPLGPVKRFVSLENGMFS